MDNITDNITIDIQTDINTNPKVFSYADIVKGLKPVIKNNDNLIKNEQAYNNQSNNNTKETIFIQPRVTNILNAKIPILLNKILKQEKNNRLYSVALSEIKNIIIRTNITYDSIVKSMFNINYVLNNYKIKKLIEINKINPHHKYVASSISTIIKKYFTQNHNELVIADIGGGEGNVVKFIGNNLNISDKNLFCIEQFEWSEKYSFENKINYIFWDNVDINLPEKSIDVFLLMVSMHHMTNNVINNVLLNISKLLKDNGIIIIKEHDACTDDIIKIINWEHHLYHIVTSPNDELSIEKLNSYLISYIDNFKSKQTFDDIFNEHGFYGVEELDRQFSPLTKYDELNTTNLYWKIYKKH
jgi:SAM-dependent methyltransferase